MRVTYRFPNINLALQQYAALVGELTRSGGDQEFMKDVIELLKEHPSLIANMNAIQKAYGQLRADYWTEFVRELRLQLRARGIECGEPKNLNQGYVQLPFGSKHHVHFEAKTELRFMIERQEGNPGLWLGLAAHHHGAETKQVGGRILENLALVETVRAQWVADFGGRFHGVVNEWWPLGRILLSAEFLSDPFLAEHATLHSAPIAKQVALFCNQIEKFTKAVETLWPA